MKYTLLLLLAFTCTMSFAYNIEWSESIKVKKRAKAPEVIGQDGEHIYLVRFRGANKLIIDRYKAGNLKSILSKEIDLSYKDKSIQYIKGYTINNQQIITSFFYNKKTKETYFFYQILSKNLSVSKPHLIGSTLREKNKFDLYNNFLTSSNELELIADEKNENLFGFLPPGDKDVNERTFSGVLIDNLEETPKKVKTTIEYLITEFHIIKEELGNDGRFYIMGYKKIEQQTGKIFKSSTTFRGNIEFYAIDIETGEFEQETFKFNNEIQQLSFKVASNGTIFISGLTSTEEKGVNGTVSILLDNNLNELNRSIDKFPESFVTTSFSEKQLKKLDRQQTKASKKGLKEPDAIMYNYDIKYILQNANGSFTMLAEQYYIEVITTTTTNANGGMSTTTKYIYHYDDIIAVNFSKEGDFIWRKLIAKTQESSGDYGFYSSFLPIKNGENLGIIYNVKGSDIENKAKSERNKTFCMNITITPEGDVSEGILFENEEKEKMKIAPKFCSQLSDEKVIIFAKSTRGSQIGIITL